MSTLYIEPWAPWRNGYAESFDGLFGDELPESELFADLREVGALSACWKNEYNHGGSACRWGVVPRPSSPRCIPVLRHLSGLRPLTPQRTGMGRNTNRLTQAGK